MRRSRNGGLTEFEGMSTRGQRFSLNEINGLGIGDSHLVKVCGAGVALPAKAALAGDCDEKNRRPDGTEEAAPEEGGEGVGGHQTDEEARSAPRHWSGGDEDKADPVVRGECHMQAVSSAGGESSRDLATGFERKRHPNDVPLPRQGANPTGCCDGR